MNSKREASVQASALVASALACVLLSGGWPTALAAYLFTWFAMGRVESLRFSHSGLLVFGVLAIAGLTLQGDRWIDQETTYGTIAHLEDRLRIEGVPSIAPSVVHGDHPQDFYIHAPGAAQVHVRLGPRATITAERVASSLSAGLFRLHYDPRRHGEVAQQSGPVEAHVYVDGVRTTRSLEYAAPLSHPRDLCASPDGTLAATPSLESDELFIVDAAGRVHAMDVGDGPTDCVFLDERRVAIGHRFGPTLWVVDARRRQVLRRYPVAPVERVAFSSGTLAIAHTSAADGITFVDEQWRVAHRLHFRADQLTFAGPDTLLVSRRREADLLRLRRDARGWHHDATLPLGRPAAALASAGDSVVLSVTDYVPDGRPHLANHFIQDQILRVDVASMSVTSQEITSRRSTRQGSAGETDRGISPLGLHVSADGALWVAFAGSDEVWSMSEGALPRFEDVPDIPAPQGITRLGDATVITSPSMGLIATKVGERWRVVVSFRGRGPLAADGGSPSNGVSFDEEENPRRRGERAFYEGTRAGISCQSCHLHGDSDFVLRNIGGQRLAPTLGVGGIADTSPFLRDGSYPRLRDLEHLTSTLFRGFLRRDGRRGTDLEAYMRGLPRRPVRRHERDAQHEARGLGVFVARGCTTCHAFPAFTNLAQIPAGALFPERLGVVASDEVLDTPSLLSVSTHGPYLSDGRATTLEEVFREHNTANRHGDTADLSDEDLADLVYFLEGL